MANAGTVEVDVLGNWAKFVDQGRNVGGKIGGEIQRGVDDGIDKGAQKGTRGLKAHGERGGREYGGGFASGFSGKVTGFLGAYVGAQFARGVVEQASNLQESLSKSNVVFGDSAKAVEKWSKTSAKSVLMSQGAAIEAAATYGNLFSGIGVDQGKAAEMSTTLVQLAADLASFNNTSVDDAIDALRSGLVGETEPLKRYGILINETMIKEKARTMGLVKGKEAVSDQAKLAARYALVLEQTSTAQGDVARTSTGYANSLRQAKANWENLQATLGVGVIPVLATVLGFLNQFDPKLLAIGVSTLAAAFAFGKLSGAIGGALNVFSLMATNPGVLILGAIAAAVLLIALNWDKVSAAIQRAYEWVGRLQDHLPGWAKWLLGVKGPSNGFSDEGQAKLQQLGIIDANGNRIQTAQNPVYRAAGGPVYPGRPTIVGERGPELMVPNRSGKVIPNSALAALGSGSGVGSSVVNLGGIAVHARGDLSSYSARQWEEVGTTIARVVSREIAKDRRSQGT